MSRAMLAERLWSASQADPVLLRRLQDAWRGPLDVRDALWWHAHPMTPTPDGRPDPAVALRPLQAAVFARPGADAAEPGDAESREQGQTPEERLRVLGQQRAEHARALDELLDGFEDWSADEPRDVSGVATGRAGGHLDERPLTDAAHVGAVVGPRPVRRRPLLVLATGAILGVAATLGVQAAGTRPDMGNTPLASTEVPQSRPPLGFSPPSDDPLAAIGTGPGEAFQIFAQPPVFTHRTLPAVGSDIVPESVRQISSFHSYETFAAVTFEGDYCLIIRGKADRVSSSGCTSRSEIVASGLRVDTTLRTLPDDPDFADFIEVRVTWQTDGLFQTDVADTEER